MSFANYSNGSTTVASTPTLICSIDSESSGVLLQNTGSATIYVGGADVAASGSNIGIALTNTSSPIVFIPSVAGVAHELYGIVGTGTQTITYLYPQAS